jgi:hypothetical protein
MFSHTSLVGQVIHVHLAEASLSAVTSFMRGTIVLIPIFTRYNWANIPPSPFLQATLRYAHLAPTHQLAAVQRLCDTKGVQNGATDTKTGTSDFEQAKPVTASHQ